MRILIVEDDDSVAVALQGVLEHEGHQCRRTARGDDALRLHRDAEAVLLDLGLADGEGFDALRALRQVSDVPVLIVSARGDERSIVRGLHLGADDFLVKPVRMNELLARLGAAVRHRGPEVPVQRLEVDDVVIDLVARTVHVSGDQVQLTAKEFALLAVLARRPGEAVRREQILDEVWGDALLGASRSCDVHLTALRAKLARPGLIQTIRGFGYRLVA